MRLRTSRTSIIVFFFWVALVPAVAQAQSAIAGVVRDTSGAVIPGVTVEAGSPALIEQVRAVATDDQGQYKIVDLRPGTYSVTFSLAGFTTIKREAIDLPANFTAQINGEMRVGELSETLTVTGGAPVVDVQSTTTQQVMQQRLLDAMPTGGRSYQSVGATLVGVAASSPDVGGSQGMQQSYLNAHGSDPRDNAVLVEGVRLNSMEGNGANQNYFNEGMFAEMVYQTGGIQVETSSGGIRLNLIPKDGGNTLKGDVFFSATSHALQADSALKNADPRQRAANAMDTMHDLNISVGGPVARDKVWFFASIRHWGVNRREPVDRELLLSRQLHAQQLYARHDAAGVGRQPYSEPDDAADLAGKPTKQVVRVHRPCQQVARSRAVQRRRRDGGPVVGR